MSSFPGVYYMSYLYPPLIFVQFLNIQNVQNWLVFLVFQLLRVHSKIEGSICLYVPIVDNFSGTSKYHNVHKPS